MVGSPISQSERGERIARKKEKKFQGEGKSLRIPEKNFALGLKIGKGGKKLGLGKTALESA